MFIRLQCLTVDHTTQKSSVSPKLVLKDCLYMVDPTSDPRFVKFSVKAGNTTFPITVRMSLDEAEALLNSNQTPKAADGTV